MEIWGKTTEDGNYRKIDLYDGAGVLVVFNISGASGGDFMYVNHRFYALEVRSVWAAGTVDVTVTFNAETLG